MKMVCLRYDNDRGRPSRRASEHEGAELARRFMRCFGDVNVLLMI